MKSINALILSLFAGAATFAVQYNFFPPRLHAAPFAVPSGPDWRRQMLENDPGHVGIDHAVAHLTDRLDLRAAQAAQFRRLLERQHERIMTILLTAPRTMSREQFVAAENEITGATREHLDALLSPEQRELSDELRAHQTS